MQNLLLASFTLFLSILNLLRRPQPDSGIAFGKRKQNLTNPDSILKECRYFLEQNFLTGTLHGRDYSFNQPSSYKYSPSQWLWDSGAHQIAWTALGNADRAVSDLRSLLSFQLDDGRIPEQVNWKADDMTWVDVLKTRLLYSRTDYNDLTQLPVLPYSLRSIYNATADITFLEETVPKIVAYFEWWKLTRDLEKTGLVSVLHPWETGLDLSPAYDKALGLQPKHTSRPPWTALYPRLISLALNYNFRYGWNQSKILARRSAPWGPLNWFKVQDVAVNSVYASGWGVLGDLASTFNTTLAEHCYNEQAFFEAGILKHLYHESAQRFVTGYLDFQNQEQYHDVKSIQILFPLLLDKISDRQVLDIIDLLTDETEFWTKFPIPSVSRAEPAYNPVWNTDLLWRGPTWGFPNWFIMEGLRKHGHFDVLHRLMDRWMAMVIQGGIYEMYNPETGVGYGAEGLGMSILVVDWMKHLGRV